MGPLDRLRSWLGGVIGRGEQGVDEDGEDAADPRLDPENVTEVRTEAVDDSAATLTDLRERREAEGVGSEGDE